MSCTTSDACSAPIIAGDGAAAERAAAEHVTTFEGEIRKVI